MIEYMNKRTINNKYIFSLILFMSVNSMNRDKEDISNLYLTSTEAWLSQPLRRPRMPAPLPKRLAHSRKNLAQLTEKEEDFNSTEVWLSQASQKPRMPAPLPKRLAHLTKKPAQLLEKGESSSYDLTEQYTRNDSPTSNSAVEKTPSQSLTEIQSLDLSDFCDDTQDILDSFLSKHSLEPTVDVNVLIALPILREFIDKLKEVKDSKEYKFEEIIDSSANSLLETSCWYQLNNFRPILNSFSFYNFDQHKIPPLFKGKYKVMVDYINLPHRVTLYFPIREQIPEPQISVTLFKNGEFKSVTP